MTSAIVFSEFFKIFLKFNSKILLLTFYVTSLTIKEKYSKNDYNFDDDDDDDDMLLFLLSVKVMNRDIEPILFSSAFHAL